VSLHFISVLLLWEEVVEVADIVVIVVKDVVDVAEVFVAVILLVGG